MLWKDTIDSGAWPESDLYERLWPLQYPASIETPSLVFVGMNPAYTKRDDAKIQEKSIKDANLLLDADGRVKLCKDTECPPSPYFCPFDSFIEGTGLPRWVHLDMFAVKHTDQNAVKRALGMDGEWTDFAARQFDIFRKLLEQIDPPVIVVPNAYASRKMHEKFEVEKMSPEHGCHFLKLNNRRVPVFFSGMLTGQRAMDVYSRERLVYQVRNMIMSIEF